MALLRSVHLIAANTLMLTLMPIAIAAQIQEPNSSVNEQSSPAAPKEIQSRPDSKQRQLATTAKRDLRINWYLRHLKHPLTPRDLEMRAAVKKLGTSHWRFVHVELYGHKIVTGNIVGISDEGFNLETGILGAGKFVTYRQVATAPREVAAVGTRTLRTVEWTGFVAICVAAIPLAVVFYPLVIVSVIQD